jgi:hypothetical protein
MPLLRSMPRERGSDGSAKPQLTRPRASSINDLVAERGSALAGPLDVLPKLRQPHGCPQLKPQGCATPPQCAPVRGRIERWPWLSTSERQTLRYIAEGAVDPRELDWLALQRLKRAGFIEQRSTGPRITAEGRRALQRLLARA